jgi:hypothetical protein
MSGTPPIGAVVDGHALVQVVWVALATGIGVTGVFGLAILGATRAVDLRRDGHLAEAAIFAAVGVVALAAVAAAIVWGIVVMTEK